MATNTVATKQTHTAANNASGNTSGPYTISFDYLLESDVEVRVNNTLKTQTTHYTFPSKTSIQFTSGNFPTLGATIEIKRNTDITVPKVDFQDGSVLTESDLDNNSKHLLFGMQETKEDTESLVNTFVSPTAPTGISNGARWYDTVSGRTFIYYVDTDTAQWVEASPPFDASEFTSNITNANIATNAAIAGTKISANFGTQNITSAGKLRLNPDDNSTTWQRENKNLHQIRDDVYVEGTVNVGDKAGFDFTPLTLNSSSSIVFDSSNSRLTLTTTNAHSIGVGTNVLLKNSANDYQISYNTSSGTSTSSGTTIVIDETNNESGSVTQSVANNLAVATTTVTVHTPADPRGCINVAKDHDKFDQNGYNPILRGYVGKDLDTQAGVNTEFFKIQVKKDSSATDHVATLLHSTREFGAGQRLALTIDDGDSYPDGKNLVLTQNGVKITADDSAFTDSDELLEVEGNAKIDGNLEITGTLSAGGDGTITGDELFISDSIKHIGDTDTIIAFPGNDSIRLMTAGGDRIRIDGSVIKAHNDFLPAINDSLDLGNSSFRWDDVYATNGTINTSDQNLKQNIASLTEAEKAVATTLKGLVKTFKYKSAVAAKGDKARIHCGVIAQEVKTAFEAQGLKAEDYALFCYDEWPAQAEEKFEDGTIKTPAREAGNQYSIRYTELLAFIISTL